MEPTWIAEPDILPKDNVTIVEEPKEITSEPITSTGNVTITDVEEPTDNVTITNIEEAKEEPVEASPAEKVAAMLELKMAALRKSKRI